MLHSKYDLFNRKIESANFRQKDLLKKIKNIKDISANIDVRKKKIDENKLAKDVKDVIMANQEVSKCKKLSYGMISALEEIEKIIDQKIKDKS